MKPRFEIGDNLSVVIMIFMLLIFLSVMAITAANAQTVTLPTWVADSLIYEAKLSRQCSQVMTAQQEEIKALGAENVHLGTALKLSQSESSTLSNLVDNAKKGQDILTQQFALDLSKEKRKTKRWRKVSIAEAVGLIGVLILML